MDVPFLTAEEKTFVKTALTADGTIAKNEVDDEFSWHQVIRAWQQPHVLLMAVAGFVSGECWTERSLQACTDSARRNYALRSGIVR